MAVRGSYQPDRSFRRSYGTLVVATVAFGLLFGSNWGEAIAPSIFGATWIIPCAFVASAATSLVLAVAGRKAVLDDQLRLRLAAAMLAIHALAAVCAASGAPFANPLLLGFASSVFGGVFFALASWGLLQYVSAFEPQQAALSVAGAFLVANLYSSAFYFLSAEEASIPWLFGELCSLILSFAVFSAKAFGPSVDSGAFAHDAATESSKQAIDTVSSPSPAKAKLFATFALFAAVLMVVQGFYSNMSGLWGLGFPIFQREENSLVFVGVRMLVFLFCLIWSGRIREDGVIFASSVVWIAGIAVSSFAWNAEVHGMGAFILLAGHYMLQSFCLIYAAQCVREKQASAAVALNVMLAIAVSNQATRMASLFFADTGLLDVEAAIGVSVAALCIVSLAGIGTMFYLNRKVSPVSPSHEALTECAALDGNPFVERELSFAERFKRFCEENQLTEREREVLFESLHGYTAADVANRLCLSEETVKTYLKRAYARAGCTNRRAILTMMSEGESR